MTEETEEIKTFPLYPYLLQGLAQLQVNISWTPQWCKIHNTFASPNHPGIKCWITLPINTMSPEHGSALASGAKGSRFDPLSERIFLYSNMLHKHHWQGTIFGTGMLTLVLKNPIYPAFANSVDPDQLASEEANWSESALFAIQYVNLYQQPWSSNLIGWKLEMDVASSFIQQDKG